jgi:acetylornithine deacetylase/succinyl-diaminopimelate desuccinylase family protein
MIDAKVKEDVLAAVEGLGDELLNLVVNTVRIPSVNPNYPGEEYDQVLGGETAINKFLRPVMEDAGLTTDMWEEEKGRANLVGVCKGYGGGKSLIFNGHVDVVPPGPLEDWDHGGPWSGEIAEERIWGRGSCDMKGGNAGAIMALKAVLQAGYKPMGDVIIEDVVGEEMMNHEAGTTAAIKRGYTADAAIVVEPSEPPARLAIIPSSPGLFYMVVTIKGKAVHASMRYELIRAGGLGDEIGVNSIDKAIIIYNALRQLEEEWGQTKSHPLYTRPGHFTLHPGVITGGPSGPFVISDESQIHYAIWYPPQDDPQEVKREVEAHIALHAQSDPWLRKHPPKIEWSLNWPAFDVDPNAPICQAVHTAYEAVLDAEPVYYGFAAVDDAAFLNLGGIPAITIGPGDLRVAHAPNEFLDIQELMDATKIYALSIVGWCGVK